MAMKWLVTENKICFSIIDEHSDLSLQCHLTGLMKCLLQKFYQHTISWLPHPSAKFCPKWSSC